MNANVLDKSFCSCRLVLREIGIAKNGVGINASKQDFIGGRSVYVGKCLFDQER